MSDRSSNALIVVFRFFIKTRTVSQPSALAAMVEATYGSASSISMTPSFSLVSSPSVASTTGTPPPEEVADLHILIVEDNVINQTVLKRQILKAGLTCDGGLFR